MITLTAKINVLEENNSFNKTLSSANVETAGGEFVNVLGTKTAVVPYRGLSVADENGDLDTTREFVSDIYTKGLFGGRGVPRFGGRVGKEILVTCSASTGICGAKLDATYTALEISIEKNGVRIASIPSQENDLFRFEPIDIVPQENGTVVFNGYFYIPLSYTETHELDEVLELIYMSDFKITLKEQRITFNPHYEFIVATDNATDHLVVAFADGMKPQYIEINGQEFYCANDTVILPTSGKTHNLVIRKMATPYSYVAINGIYTGATINIDRTNIISIETKLADRGDLRKPSFGIISNAGYISYIDSNEETLELANKNLLQEGKKCEVFLSNTIVRGKTEKVADFETEQWDYDLENKVVSVSVKDELVEWQEINVDVVEYNPRKPEIKPLSWFYRHLWDITKRNYDMLSFDELSDDTKAVFDSIFIRYPLLEKGTLWQQWEKVCVVGQSHIYKGKDGKIVCRYNGGN